MLSIDQANEMAAKLIAAHMPSVFDAKGKDIINTDSLSWDDLCLINSRVYADKVRKDIAAFDTTPAIKAYMTAHVEDRGARSPSKSDMSYLANAINSTRDQWGKARKPWKPTKALGLKLKVKEAVSFTYSQEAYADYSTTLIPIEGWEKINLMMHEEAKQFMDDANVNIDSMVRYSNSHTGWAGSGSNYEAHIESNEHGMFAIVSCRTSIAD